MLRSSVNIKVILKTIFVIVRNIQNVKDATVF